MAHKYGKKDSNQTEIVKCFRQLGCSVKILSDVGNGFPDIEIATNSYNCLVEIKSSDGKLTEDQVTFFDTWQGMKCVIKDVDGVVRLVNFLNSLPAIDLSELDLV